MENKTTDQGEISVEVESMSALVLPKVQEKNDATPRVRKTRKKPENRAQTTTLAERMQIIETLEENSRTHRYSLARVARALGRNENSVRSIWKNRDTIRKSVELSGTSQGYLRRADPDQLLLAQNRPERLKRKAERRRQKRAEENAERSAQRNTSFPRFLSQAPTPSNDAFAVVEECEGIEIFDGEDEIKIETISDQDDDQRPSNVIFKEIDEISEDDFKAKTPLHMNLPYRPKNILQPTISGNIWTASVDLTELPTEPSDIRVGVDLTKKLIIPQGKYAQTIVRPDGVKVSSSTAWSKEIQIPDIVQIKPSIKLQGKILKIECELKPEFQAIKQPDNSINNEPNSSGQALKVVEAGEGGASSPSAVLPIASEGLKVGIPRNPNAPFSSPIGYQVPLVVTPGNQPKSLFTPEEESVLEASYNNYDNTLSEHEIEKLTSMLNKSRAHIINWFQQRAMKRTTIQADDGVTITDKKKMILEEFFAENNFPDKEKIINICSKTGLLEKVVWAWFRGRRRIARMTNEKLELPNTSTIVEPSSKEADSVKIEVLEDEGDDGVTILEIDDEVKTESFSDQDDDRPLTEAIGAMDDSMDE